MSAPYYPQPGYYPPPAQQKSSGLAVAGGAMIIISAILGFVVAIALFFAGDIVSSYGLGGYDDTVMDILYVCGGILMIFAIIALLGGVMAVTKKSYGLAILGGIFALFCIGPYGLASILGLIGLILVIVGKSDFPGHQPPAPQVVFVQPPPPAYQQAPPAFQQPPPAPVKQMRTCLGCGSSIEESFNNCPHCGKPRQ